VLSELGFAEQYGSILASLSDPRVHALLKRPVDSKALDAAVKEAGVKSLGHRLKIVNGLIALGELPAATEVLSAVPTPSTLPPEATEEFRAAFEAGVDVESLVRLARSGDRGAVSERLRGHGIKTGLRLKLEKQIFAAAEG